MVLCYTPLIENITAIASGGVAPNLLSMMTILLIVQAVGGPGCLFGLFIDMAIFTKSERYKTQGKLQLVPGLFNVIEPAIYGLPVVLNFTLLIPFVGLPIIVYTLMYICLKVGSRTCIRFLSWWWFRFRYFHYNNVFIKLCGLLSICEDYG